MTTKKDANTAGAYRLEMPDRRTIVLYREGEPERLTLLRDSPNAAFATLHNDAEAVAHRLAEPDRTKHHPDNIKAANKLVGYLQGSQVAALEEVRDHLNAVIGSIRTSPLLTFAAPPAAE